jgi:hypothetical protein
LPAKNVFAIDGGKPADNDSDLLEESNDEVEVIKSSYNGKYIVKEPNTSNLEKSIEL